jgi:hypothetical protein
MRAAKVRASKVVDMASRAMDESRMRRTRTRHTHEQHRAGTQGTTKAMKRACIMLTVSASHPHDTTELLPW